MISTLAPIQLWPNASAEELEIVIRAVYRQVLGNAHVMESERMTVPESKLQSGEISVREFVRQLAKSELYRSRFFDNCPRYRSMELNFKHLLGRAPYDYSETFLHSQILDRGGFEAEIDSYLDSDEYQDAFGEDIVPYDRGSSTQTGQKLLGFTNAFKLNKSLSTSDKAGVEGNQARLIKQLIYNNPEGKERVTDVKQLLAQLFKTSSIPQKTAAELARARTESALELKEKEQASILEALEKEYAELRPLASFAEQALSKWESAVEEPQPTLVYPLPMDPWGSQPSPADSLEQRIQQQSDKIAELQTKIADARRLAAYSETQLNKWKRRSFSIR